MSRFLFFDDAYLWNVSKLQNASVDTVAIKLHCFRFLLLHKFRIQFGFNLLELLFPLWWSHLLTTSAWNILPRMLSKKTEFQSNNSLFCRIQCLTIDSVLIGQFFCSVIAEIIVLLAWLNPIPKRAAVGDYAVLPVKQSLQNSEQEVDGGRALYPCWLEVHWRHTVHSPSVQTGTAGKNRQIKM